MDDSEVWYRYEDCLESTGYTDVTGEYVPTGSRVVVRVWKCPVIKHTPKGTVVRDPCGERRFIADSWVKKYACPTLEAAVQSFVARKTRQASIHEARAANARRAAADAVTRPPKFSLHGVCGVLA